MLNQIITKVLVITNSFYATCSAHLHKKKEAKTESDLGVSEPQPGLMQSEVTEVGFFYFCHMTSSECLCPRPRRTQICL